MAEEYPKPNEKRLEEYADARKPQIAQVTRSTAPIYPELEIETLTYSLTKLREVFSVDDSRIRQAYRPRAGRSAHCQRERK